MKSTTSAVAIFTLWFGRKTVGFRNHLVFLIVANFASNSFAGSNGVYRLMGEQDTSATAGDESYIYNYDSYGNLLANNSSGAFATQINWLSTHATAGLAYDGAYRLMGEQDTSTAAGSESVIYTYDTYADLLANNWSSFSVTQIDWSPAFSTAALVYDGRYRLMGEQDTSASAGEESVIYTYDTYADLLSNNWSSNSITQISWSAAFSTASLTYDGTYRLMGEQDTSAAAGSESFIYTYDTFADLLANSWSSSTATQFDWIDTYATAALVYVPLQGADFDMDEDVDGDDFLIWQSGFGTTSGATTADGDADCDGDVDGDDFLLWQSQFGTSAGTAAVTSVPEPGSLALAFALLSLVTLVFCHRSRIITN